MNKSEFDAHSRDSITNSSDEAADLPDKTGVSDEQAYGSPEEIGLIRECQSLRHGTRDIDLNAVMNDPKAALIQFAAAQPVLDADRERELARRARRGDHAARKQLVESNLLLVIAVAGRYRARHASDMDLIQSGNEGLLLAAERFDPDRGVRFSTYAVWWIRRNVARTAGVNDRIAHVPEKIDDQASMMARLMRTVLSETGVEASDEVLAGRMQIPLGRVKLLRQSLVSRDEVALESPPDVTEEYDQKAPIRKLAATASEEGLQAQHQQQIEQLIEASGLTATQAEVIRLIYMTGGGPPRTNVEVARMRRTSANTVGRRRLEAEVKMRLAARRLRLERII